MQGFFLFFTVSALSGSTYLEIKWSCYGEAVARLPVLCVTATAVCAAGARPLNICNHDELVFSSLLISIHNISIILGP